MTEQTDQLVESEPETGQPKKKRSFKERVELFFLGCVIVFGGLSGGCQVGTWIKDRVSGKRPFFKPKAQSRFFSDVDVSKNPGPPRDSKLEFILDATNSKQMTGMNDHKNERWMDVADNFYTRKFASIFDYTKTPTVRVKVEPKGKSFKGRLEAYGLKPNFAYQIKISGDYNHPKAFERIGYVGRWRLPGGGTNFTDADYRSYPKSDLRKVEAYVLFDYFVTDRDGCAVRNFELDSSLHVLWRDDQDTWGVKEGTSVKFVVDASDSQVYSDPVFEDKTVGIWAERERERYTSSDQVIRLPKGSYKAFLELTEESLHSYHVDGGFWATVMRMPVAFQIDE